MVMGNIMLEFVLSRRKDTGEEYALKIVDKSGMGKDELDGLKTEIEILKTLEHDNIIKVYEVFESSHKTFIVTELVKGKSCTLEQTRRRISKRVACCRWGAIRQNKDQRFLQVTCGHR